ncbi:nucleoside hydrolase [Bifidobacterium scaligerum]|uniref:Nucleoside hydrolase n=1 Tax=Bifidobacterium scaligerum TaxID=2052656 RepID=A0A2M9HR51_9BIFI|nr:nucleoside hydrolase [Bifidobacterium scaligerum]
MRNPHEHSAAGTHSPDASVLSVPSAVPASSGRADIGNRNRTRIIACVDTGVDDALALAYLLASPACELVGVIAGYGNVDAATAIRNTNAVLALFGRSDIPVYQGSTHPSWASSFIPDAGCAQFHGPDGLGGYLDGRATATTTNAAASNTNMTASQADVDGGIVSVGGYPLGDPHANPAHPYALPLSAQPTSTPRSEVQGTDFLIGQVRRYGHNVTVLTTGPLTDVDAALTKAPAIAEKLHLVMMGGTLTQPGNCWDTVAETNIIQDPEAANRVFHCGADITMVGLDVTHQCLLPQTAVDRWTATGTERGRFLARLADFSIAANRQADPALFADGMPLHDPLAAAVALDRTLVGCLDIAMRAETRTGDFAGVRGRTTGDPVGLVTPSMPRIHVALTVDAARFVNDFIDRLTGLCR